MSLTRVLVAIGAVFMFAQIVRAEPVRTKLDNGDQVQWDGTYYDFRAADGRKMVKLWVPPKAKVMRGIIVSGHGGGTGDSRQFARDPKFRAFAARHDFGICGIHWFPGREMFDKGSPVFFAALNEFAKLGKHPELANVPFVVFGGSNGGATSYGLACAAPNRAICFTPNASAWWNPEKPTDDMLRIPAIFVVGMFDPFMRGTGVETTARHVADARARGARWSFIVEEKGHEDGATWQIFTRFWDRCIELRIPKDADPAKGPVTLNDIPQESGWLVDPSTWGSGLTVVAPYAEYKGDKAAAGWVPDADIAYLYRSVATYNNPIILGSPDLAKAFNPDTDYRSRLVGVVDPPVAPGKTVRLVCDTKAFPGWSKLEFYDGSRKLGEVKAGQKPQLSIVVEKAPRVYNISVLGYKADKTIRASTPLYFYVSDPSVVLLSETEINPPLFDKASRSFTGAAAGQPVKHAVNDSDNVLAAYALSAEQEKQWNGADKKLSPFWAAFDSTRDQISMNPKRNAPQGNSFSVVIDNDARLVVKAAHSAAGLYLLFEATDNRFVDVADTNMYIAYDAIDMLIDSRSAEDICAGDTNSTFVNRFWGLSLTTRQYQVAYGDTAPVRQFKRNISDPWDFNYVLLSLDDGKKRYGIEIDFAVIDKYRKAQEWFIPWSELGLEAAPARGARLGFAPGYNDHDPGEFMPGAHDQLRWIDRSSPWGYASQERKAPMGWGNILIAD